MKLFKKILPLVLGLFVMAGSVYAQAQKVESKDVSDQELKSFVATANQVQKMRREARTKMQKMIKDEGLQPRRFQMIMMSQKNPKMADSLDVTKEEQQAVENIKPEMKKVNQQMVAKFQSTIKENDLTQQRFQQIAQALRADKDLQQRFQKLQAKQMKMNAGSNDDNDNS